MVEEHLRVPPANFGLRDLVGQLVRLSESRLEVFPSGVPVPAGRGHDAGDHLPQTDGVAEHDLVLVRFQDQRVQIGGVLAVTENRKPFDDAQ